MLIELECTPFKNPYRHRLSVVLTFKCQTLQSLRSFIWNNHVFGNTWFVLVRIPTFVPGYYSFFKY